MKKFVNKIWRNKVSLFIIGLFLLSISVYALTSVPVGTINRIENAVIWTGSPVAPESLENPLLVQQASSANAPANPNEFYYQGQISSSLSGINACIVPTSGHTMYLTHVILQDIEAAGTTSNWQAGIAVGLSGGTSTSGTMSAVNTTVSTFAAPVVNSYSAAPTFTSFYNFLFLFNSAPATITSEVQRSISLAGTAELPIVAAVSSQGQEICFYDNTAGQEVSFMIEGYEQ